MRKARDEQVDPSQPALIVTYGNTTRKFRPLERDLVVIGRSPCCDIGLVSPEVAPIHCVIVKTADSWRIRDCTGRGGTHVNGKSIHDEVLTDCDVLQIGTFSFQVNLPQSAATEQSSPQAPSPSAAAVASSQRAVDPVDEPKTLHLRQSRERLARHALNLRRRLRDKQSAAADPTAPPRGDAELSAQRAELEQREKQLRFWDKELTEEDRRLREELGEIEQQRKELQRFADESLARKQAELEAKAEVLLASRRDELEAQAEHILAERRRQLDQIADSQQAREQELERERGQLENTMVKAAAEKKAELSAYEESLANKQRELDQQLIQIEEINAALDEARDGLRLEQADVERTRELARLELETQVYEAEQYVALLWQQCEAHRRRIEEKHGPLAASLSTDDQTRALAIRARELDAYAQHLQHMRSTLTQYEQELSEAYQQFHAEYDNAVREAQTIKDQAVAEAEAISRASQQSDPLSDTAHGESRLHDDEVTAAVLGELREEHERRCAELTAQLANERQRLQKAETTVKSLKNDLTALRGELRQREEALDQLREELELIGHKSEPSEIEGEIRLAAPDQLLALAEKLQKELANRDDRIGELDRHVQHLEKLTGYTEKAAYEAELNRYHAELEQDRIAVSEELARLEMIRGEVEEARQEMELLTSRERVQIAREWVEINRIREQLRREHAQRKQTDSGVRERVAKGKQTKIEAVDLTPSAASATPSQQDLIARLRPASTHNIEVRP